MLSLERNRSLKNVSFEEVISSGLKDPRWMKPFRAKAYPGDEPFEDEDDIPEGICCINEKGLIFIVFDINAVTFKLTKVKEESISTKFGQELIIRLSDELIPFAGLGTAFIINKLKNLKVKGPDYDIDMRRIMSHPNTFAVPYINIVKVKTIKRGGVFNREVFLIIESESRDGKTENYCIESEKIYTYYHESMMEYRFSSELEYTVELILDEEIGMNKKKAELLETLFNNHGEINQMFDKEFELGMFIYKENKFRELGLTSDIILAMARERLQHFQDIAPKLNKEIVKFLSVS